MTKANFNSRNCSSIAYVAVFDQNSKRAAFGTFRLSRIQAIHHHAPITDEAEKA